MADRQTIRDAAPVTPENPAAFPRLMRLVQGRLVAGVAQGAAAGRYETALAYQA